MKEKRIKRFFFVLAVLFFMFIVANQAGSVTTSIAVPINSENSEIEDEGGIIDDAPSGIYACNDGIDNDGDGAVDLDDLGCAGQKDNSEQSPDFVCDDGLDNDADGLIDVADSGCADGPDNDETNPRLVCESAYEKKNVSLDVEFIKIENWVNGNMDKKVFANNGAEVFDDEQKIPLIANSIFIEDALIKTDVPGIAIQRGHGWVRFMLQGNDKDNVSKESMNAIIDFNRKITQFINSPIWPVERQGDGIFKWGHVGQDEVFPSIGKQRARWISTVTTGADSFYLWYNFDDVVFGGCACQDGIDNDGDGLIDMADPDCTDPLDNDEKGVPECSDGINNDKDSFIDYPDDPGCRGPNDPSELNLNVECDDGIDNDGDGLIDMDDPGCYNPTDESEVDPKAQCSDGIDNDGDGLIDYPNDPGCWSAQDGDERDPAKICQGTNDESVRLRVKFDKVENIGDGDMKKRVYVDDSADYYNSGEWIPLVVGGIPITDANYDLDVPGMALQRGEGYVLISIYGKHDKGEGMEITSAEVELDKAKITGTLNGLKSEGNGPYENQGDGKYILGNANQDEYIIHSDEEAELFSTVTTHIDSVYIYYNYITKKTGGCACQDGIDNDGDGLIDMADPGCTDPLDDDEGNLIVTANANPDTGIKPLKVLFSCSATGGTGPYKYSWVFGDGRTSFNQNPLHTYFAKGNYDATCAVVDKNSNSGNANVNVKVRDDTTPDVTCTANPLTGTAPLSVTFNGNATGGNAPLSYKWEFGDGQTSTNKNVVHVYANQGTYHAIFTVTDKNGDDAECSKTITVMQSTQLEVEAEGNPDSGAEPLEVHFSCTATGGIASYTYLWDFGDGHLSTHQNPTHVYNNEGKYTAICTVTDHDGNVASDEEEINVIDDATKPKATCNADPKTGKKPLTVTFTGSGSGGDPPFTYEWNFGDGDTSDKANTKHTYTDAGTFVATFTVTDSDGDEAECSKTITVRKGTSTEDFAPIPFMCDGRIFIEDNLRPGRISTPGQELIERINNYAFEGEQLQWPVVVVDKNGADKVRDVYVSIGKNYGPGNRIEANCKLVKIYEFNETIPADCAVRIDEEWWPVAPADDVAALYNCTFSVETPESMHGPYYIEVEAEDNDGLIGVGTRSEYWFLNPTIGTSVEGDIEFGEVRPGTTVYSAPILVGNGAEQGSGVIMDMFVSGTDFYDPSHSGGKCPTTNKLSLKSFSYYAVNGAYTTSTDNQTGRDGQPDTRDKDVEGYVDIGYANGYNSPYTFYDGYEIIQSPLMKGPYYLGNLLMQGSEMTVTVKLNLPLPCNGDFSDGSINFWGEAI